MNTNSINPNILISNYDSRVNLKTSLIYVDEQNEKDEESEDSHQYKLDKELSIEDVNNKDTNDSIEQITINNSEMIKDRQLASVSYTKNKHALNQSVDNASVIYASTYNRSNVKPSLDQIVVNESIKDKFKRISKIKKRTFKLEEGTTMSMSVKDVQRRKEMEKSFNNTTTH